MSSQPASARDPVCGTLVPISDREELSEEYAGVMYFFCSQECLERFIQDTDIFTLDIPLGAQATHDRGMRSPRAAPTAARVTFEQSHT